MTDVFQQLEAWFKTISPNQWAVALSLGVLAGLIANHAPHIIYAIRMLFYRGPIFREWNHYYFNFDVTENDATPVFHHENVKVYRGMWLYPKVRATHENKEITYQGKAIIKKGYLWLEMKCHDFDERVYEFFSLPNFKCSHDVIICGVALAEDFTGRPAVAAVVLSANRLDEQDILAIYRANYQQNKSKAVIVLKKTACFTQAYNLQNIN